jgi:hypothetical protein
MQVSDDKFEEQAARDGTFSNLAPSLIRNHFPVVMFAALGTLLLLHFVWFDRAFHKFLLLSFEFIGRWDH